MLVQTESSLNILSYLNILHTFVCELSSKITACASQICQKCDVISYSLKILVWLNQGVSLLAQNFTPFAQNQVVLLLVSIESLSFSEGGLILSTKPISDVTVRFVNARRIWKSFITIKELTTGH